MNIEQILIKTSKLLLKEMFMENPGVIINNNQTRLLARNIGFVLRLTNNVIS